MSISQKSEQGLIPLKLKRDLISYSMQKSAYLPLSKLWNETKKVLEATEELIIQYGWEKVTFRMITSAADMDLAAFDYHFGSKKYFENAFLCVKKILDIMPSQFYNYRQKNRQKTFSSPIILSVFFEPPTC